MTTSPTLTNFQRKLFRPVELSDLAIEDAENVRANELNNPTRDNISLSTVLIKVLTMDGHKLECQAFLDSGSQLNCITEHLVERPGLKEFPHALCIQEIGQGTQRTSSIQSRTTRFSIRIETFVEQEGSS